MSNENIKYSNEPLGKIKMVDDFLPTSKDLVLKQDAKKVTFAKHDKNDKTA